MCRSMLDSQSATTEIRRGKKKKEEENRTKIWCPHLLCRVAIKIDAQITFTQNGTDSGLCSQTQWGELATLPERMKNDAKKVKHMRYLPINQRQWYHGQSE